MAEAARLARTAVVLGTERIADGGLVREAVPLMRNIGRNSQRLHEITEQIVHLEGRADGLHEKGLKALFQAHGAERAMDFIVGRECGRAADYSIASGVFNVRLDHSAQLWTAHIRIMLTDLHRSSRKGFAVNFMLPAAVTGVPELYGSLPDPWVAYCETVLGRPVELVQGYGLPEYTLLVR